MKISHLKLGINYQGKPYHLIWINPNPSKKELFFQLISSSKTKKLNVPEIKDGKFSSFTGFFDHISFHKDGKVHIKFKGKKEYQERDNIGHSIYDFNDNKIVTLLNYTFHLNEKSHYFREISEEEISECKIIWKIEKPMIFTMLVFLAQHKNYQSFTDNYIKKKLNIRSTPIIIDMGNENHCLMVLLTAKIPIDYKNGYILNQLSQLPDKGYGISMNSSLGILPPIEFLEKGLVEQSPLIKLKLYDK